MMPVPVAPLSHCRNRSTADSALAPTLEPRITTSLPMHATAMSIAMTRGRNVHVSSDGIWEQQEMGIGSLAVAQLTQVEASTQSADASDRGQDVYTGRETGDCVRDEWRWRDTQQ